MFRQSGTAMNAFPAMEKPRNMATPRDLKFMNLFPQQVGFGSSLPEEEAPKMADYRYASLFFVLFLINSQFSN